MTFSNGLTLSVQFGFGNYCGNYNKPGLVQNMLDVLTETDKLQSCRDAEIAVLDQNGNWYTSDIIEELEDDDVVGYITPDRLAEIIPLVKNYPVYNAESEAKDG